MKRVISEHTVASISYRMFTLIMLGAMLLGGLFEGRALAVPFTVSTNQFKNLDNGQNIPQATPTANTTFKNCIVQEGCLGADGFVFMFDNQNPPTIVDAAANLPDRIEFRFVLNQAQINEINLAIAGFGIVTIDAARDIGKRCAMNDPQDPTKCGGFNAGTTKENLSLRDGENQGFSDLLFEDFESAKACPTGENAGQGGNGDVINMNCGPNFHTDVRGLSFSQPISQAILKQMAQDGVLIFTVDPNKQGLIGDRVGRLKLFEASFTYNVPEPSSLLLLAFGVAALVAQCRVHRKAARTRAG